MKREICMIGLILAVGGTTAFAFPEGDFTNKNGNISVKKGEGKNYDILAIASNSGGHSCEVSGTLPETTPNVLSGKIDGKPVNVKLSKGVLVLKAKDAEVCGIGVTISGKYKKK